MPERMVGEPPIPAQWLYVCELLPGVYALRDRSRHARDPYQQKGGFFLTRERAERELCETLGEAAS